MIGHPDESLNYELWSAWLSLEEDQDKRTDFIINNFYDQNERIRLLILSLEIGGANKWYENFIAGVVKNDDSLEVKKKAMRLLFNNDLNSISQFTSTGSEKISKAYLEVIDFNI
jgi:arginine/ornithine N-succinyltransferase beta subunit